MTLVEVPETPVTLPTGVHLCTFPTILPTPVFIEARLHWPVVVIVPVTLMFWPKLVLPETPVIVPPLVGAKETAEDVPEETSDVPETVPETERFDCTITGLTLPEEIVGTCKFPIYAPPDIFASLICKSVFVAPSKYAPDEINLPWAFQIGIYPEDLIPEYPTASSSILSRANCTFVSDEDKIPLKLEVLVPIVPAKFCTIIEVGCVFINLQST